MLFRARNAGTLNNFLSKRYRAVFCKSPKGYKSPESDTVVQKIATNCCAVCERFRRLPVVGVCQHDGSIKGICIEFCARGSLPFAKLVQVTLKGGRTATVLPAGGMSSRYHPCGIRWRFKVHNPDKAGSGCNCNRRNTLL